MKKNALILVAAMILALSLTACGGEAVTQTSDFPNQQGRASASDSETPALESIATGIITGNSPAFRVKRSPPRQIKQENISHSERARAFCTGSEWGEHI